MVTPVIFIGIPYGKKTIELIIVTIGVVIIQNSYYWSPKVDTISDQ